jgi:protease-4
MTPEEIDPLAEGRVWSATDALQNGLVDKLGSLQDAIASAAALAKVTDYQVEYVEQPLSARDMLMRQLANRVGSLDVWPAAGAGAALSGLLAPLQEAARELGSLQDPRHIYMRCIACGLLR